ncbi:hypothetical protein D3C85_950890 [compost metagenome]
MIKFIPVPQSLFEETSAPVLPATDDPLLPLTLAGSLLTATPSTIIKARLSPVNEVLPRTTILDDPPSTPPPDCEICKPATLPIKPWAIVGAWPIVKSLPATS